MVDKIRVILADDHQMVRQGFVSLLSQEADIEVIGEAENAQDAVELAEQVPPDVLVADWEMPGMSCQDAIRLLKEHRTPVRVLVLTMHRETEQILKALRAGACGYVIKNAPVSELVHGIRAVGRGDVFLSPAPGARS